MHEALFYSKNQDKSVTCNLCSHTCRIKDSALGICQVRKNDGGLLSSLNYASVIASHVDPIEKKPLFHFLPGSKSYSIACLGCNFQCGFCQNWQISQAKEAQKIKINSNQLEASKVVANAVSSNCQSISYTYTEPTVYFEFAYDCAKLASQAGLYNNFVTNGYMSAEALEYIAEYLDAANVDLKSFSDDFYRKVCKASLKPVLDSIKLMKKLNIWIEITTLIVPGYNDSDQELSAIAGFIAGIDKEIPWHISAMHPDYKLTNLPPTGYGVLNKAFEIGKSKGLNFIYLGNVIGSGKENTLCPGCLKPVIERKGFSLISNNVKQGKCGYCNHAIAGKW